VREAGLVRILCGADGNDPFGRPAGIAVHLDVVSSDILQTEPATSAPLSRGAAFRTAPLLAVLDSDVGRLIVIGQCQVTVDPHRAPVVRVLARWLWQASRSADPPRQARRRPGRSAGRLNTTDHNWRMVPGVDRLPDLLVPWFRNNPHAIPADGEGRATVIAKAIAESSRDEVYTLRALRYELERLIGANLRRSRTRELESVLADVVELTVAVSRARDVATEAWRGGQLTGQPSLVVVPVPQLPVIPIGVGAASGRQALNACRVCLLDPAVAPQQVPEQRQVPVGQPVQGGLALLGERTPDLLEQAGHLDGELNVHLPAVDGVAHAPHVSQSLQPVQRSGDGTGRYAGDLCQPACRRWALPVHRSQAPQISQVRTQVPRGRLVEGLHRVLPLGDLLTDLLDKVCLRPP
jgi:hypothetical protein